MSPLKKPNLPQKSQNEKTNLERRTYTEVSAYSACSARRSLFSV